MDQATDLARISMELLEQPDVDDTVIGIATYAKEVLDCHHAGVHLLVGKRIETAASTDPVIEKADELQNELGEGPCLEVLRTKEDYYVIHDTATDKRWPQFAPLAADLGLHSILAVRLFTGRQTYGALNLYAHDVRNFSRDDTELAMLFGQHASLALATARREEGLKIAVDARHLIGQAQGMLMERYGLNAEQSFAVLRRYSQDNNIKLKEVAESLISTRQLPE
jgi:GAF domain-containing protein